MNVIRVAFEDGAVIIDWMEEREQGRYGGVVHQTYITNEGMNTDAQLQYWADEIQDDCIELLSTHQKAMGRPAE